MRNRRHFANGFSLIELMIAIVIFSVLVLLAGPVFSEFMGNTQIRTAAESMLAGLRVAQSAAVKRNQPASFVVDATGWQVVGVDPETNADESPALQQYNFAEGAPHASVDRGGLSRVTFGGLGRITVNPGAPDMSDSLTCIKVSNTSIASPRKLNIAISGATGFKMCDPAVADANDPLVCPGSCGA